MYWLNSMKNYILYSDKEFLYDLPYDKKKFNGNLIVLDSKSIKDSIDIINSASISNKYTKCYYIDKTCYALIKNVKKKKIINQSNYYKKVKSSCPEIIKTYPTLDKYESLSTYFDMSGLNELFYDNATYSDKTKVNVYKNFLNNVFEREEVNSYKSKYIICTINNKVIDYETYKDSYSDFLSIILNAVYFDEDDMINYPDLKVIVLGKTSGRFFKFNLHSLKRGRLNVIKNFINIIAKLERGEQLSEEENNIDNKSVTETAKEEDTTSTKELAKEMVNSEMNVKSPKEKEISMKMNTIIDSSDKEDLTELEDDLNSDEEFLAFLEDLKNEKITSELSAKNTARNELLKEEQKKVKINNSNKTMEEIINETKDKTIEKDNIPIHGKNKEQLQLSTLRDFEKSYNKHLDNKDKMTILNCMSDDNREIKVYIRSINKEDSSTPFTKKETWTIEMEDERRVRHTIKVDFPILLEDKFMYIEGNKKVLNKQLVLLPIVKTKPDEVQIVTNSNKTFITRFGSKISPKIEKFKKFLTEIESKGIIEYKLGSSLKVNSKYLTNIEYDELSEKYIYIKCGNTTIYFNQETVREIFKEKKFKEVPDKHIVPLGISNGKPVLYDMSKNILYTESGSEEINLVDYLVKIICKKDGSLNEIYDGIKVGKKYTYSRCDILSRKIPLLLFLAYNEGLSTILHKAKINYELSDKRRVLSATEKETRGCIPFKDMYLYYDIYPYKNSLLLNSLMEINTTDYEYELFDSKEVYLDIFYDLYGSRTIAKGFDNFYELFIDGITREVLDDLNYPTTITELMLYANELLQDNQYILETEMSNYRLRSNEMINVIFEKELEKAYVTYKNSVNGASPIKISLPQDAIIKALSTNKYGSIMQDYDTLNPIKETDSISTVTYRGPSGLTLYLLINSPLHIKYLNC